MLALIVVGSIASLKVADTVAVVLTFVDAFAGLTAVTEGGVVSGPVLVVKRHLPSNCSTGIRNLGMNSWPRSYKRHQTHRFHQLERARENCLCLPKRNIPDHPSSGHWVHDTTPRRWCLQ